MPREYCNCHGTEHSLIEKDGFALMCKNCGNIYCQKQGEGSCLFCGAADGELMEKSHLERQDLQIAKFETEQKSRFQQAKANKYIKITQNIQLDTD